MLRGFRITHGFSGTKMRVTRGLGVIASFKLCQNRKGQRTKTNQTTKTLVKKSSLTEIGEDFIHNINLKINGAIVIPWFSTSI